MSLYNFIFSKKPPTRFLRHLVFWTIRACYLAFTIHSRIYWASPPPWLNGLTAIELTLYGAAEEMLIMYSIVYWLFPLFLEKKKYLAFTLSTLLLLAIVFLATYPHQIRYQLMYPGDTTYLRFWNMILNFTGVTLTPCLLFASFRLFKTNYEKLKERETLMQQTANVEFQLLKAQVHPHFLFNTLNNIYSFALNKSPKAGELLSQLSALMRYMIDDCETDLISLGKELKMLNDYIGLEKVRYGDRLDIQVDIKGDPGNKTIAPLLMIPFIENCFKHGASQVLDRPWIRLEVLTRGNLLDFTLQNSKPSSEGAMNGKNGIGLRNIKKRLELLYHSQYELDIHSGPDAFSVHMQVPLEEEVRLPDTIKSYR